MEVFRDAEGGKLLNKYARGKITLRISDLKSLEESAEVINGLEINSTTGKA